MKKLALLVLLPALFAFNSIVYADDTQSHPTISVEPTGKYHNWIDVYVHNENPKKGDKRIANWGLNQNFKGDWGAENTSRQDYLGYDLTEIKGKVYDDGSGCDPFANCFNEFNKALPSPAIESYTDETKTDETGHTYYEFHIFIQSFRLASISICGGYNVFTK